MKVMNVVFGIGIAIILYIVVLLGVHVFYPGPQWQNNNCTYPDTVKIMNEFCNENITVKQCQIQMDQQNRGRTESEKAYDECNKKFQDSMDRYNRNFLIITNLIGAAMIVASLLLFLYFSSMINIAAGTAFAGLGLIFFGFITGWQSTTDKVKFFISLIIAILIITFSVIINKRYSKISKKK